MRRTDNDGIAGNDRCSVESNFPGNKINILIVIEFEIDDPVFAKAYDGRTRFGV